MRRALLIVAASAAASLLPAGAASADWPAPAGTCPGAFQLQTLDPLDPGYMADSPAHKDRNGDGWLCYNGHAWKDDTARSR